MTPWLQLLLLPLLLLAVTADQKEAGIAKFSEVIEQQQPLSLLFEQNTHNDQVELTSSFDLSEVYQVSWKIHYLPVKMGSDSCAEHVLGDCYRCYPPQEPGLNQPQVFPEPECIQGNRLNGDIYRLPKCARLNGKDGIIGRSIVLTIQSRSLRPRVFCSTIYDKGQSSPFISVVTWLSKPYAGFFAFRKQSSKQSYIIVNVTRIDAWTIPGESFKWEIQNSNGTLYNPTDRDLESSQCSDKDHKQCAEGDLTRKHQKLELVNHGLNLLMKIDTNLDTSILTGKYLVISNTTNSSMERMISRTLIEDLPPIHVAVSFTDGSILNLKQRDYWSNVSHQYLPVDKNSAPAWEVTIHQVPTIQIFTGEIWDCDKTWAKWTEADFLPKFQTSFDESLYLNHTYTLYGRDSMLYHGVQIKGIGTTKRHCSTITYKQGDERIGYARLKTVKRQDDQQVLVLIIEHAVLRQTTFLIATMCHITRFYLELTMNNTCNNQHVYNPYHVCPACDYSNTGSNPFCSRSCGSTCCSQCLSDSSFLCPIGDLRRRLGIFPKSSVNGIKNTELVFTVQNDVNLPLNQLLGKHLGLVEYQDTIISSLVRCGQVMELKETVVFQDIGDGLGNLTISQKSAWQPLVVQWSGIKLISLTFWDERDFAFNDRFCKTGSSNDVRRKSEPKYVYTRSDLPNPTGTTLPIGEKSPSFFGRNSVLKKSLSLEYEANGETKSMRFNIKASGPSNETHKLHAIFYYEGRKMIEFNFEQRAHHISAETYITVDLLSRKYCTTTMKWYIIDKKYASKYEIGETFLPVDYDDTSFFHEKNGNCPRVNPVFHMGDLNGIFDSDLVLNGPGKVFHHEALPLIHGTSNITIGVTSIKLLTDAEGHFLFLANTNNTVIAKLELKKAPKDKEPPSKEKVNYKKSNYGTSLIVAPIVVVLVVIVGSLLVWWRCFKQTTGNEAQGYAEVQQDAAAGFNRLEPIVCINKLSGRKVWVFPGLPYEVNLKTQDCETNAIEMVHNTNLSKLYKNTRHYTLADSNGSTNGSTLTRSRGTVAEENHYTTVSPGSLAHFHSNHWPASGIGTPESSSSSIGSDPES